MMVLVTYDVNTESVEGKRRLRHVAKLCQSYGQRVQHSVFECLVDHTQWIDFKYKLEKTVDEESDSLRYYFLGKNWKNKSEHFGAKKSYDPQGILII